MKISFRENEEIQTPVTQTQQEMKAHKAKKYPVYKSFLLICMVLALAFTANLIYKKNVIYTHGIVRADELEVKAIGFDKVQSLTVEKGELVKKGDVLFTQYSSNDQNKIQKLRNALIAKEKEYDRMVDIEILNEEMAIEVPKSNEMEILILKQRGSALTRQQEISKASAKVKRLKVQVHARSKRHRDLLKLFNLDAATFQRVDAARADMHLVRNEFALANVLHGQLVQTNRIAQQEAAEQRLKLQNKIDSQDQISSTISIALFSEIDNLRSKMFDIQEKNGPSEFVAPFDAIVTDVHATQDMILTANAPILNLVSVDNLWVDVFVEADKASLMSKDKDIMIYPEGTSQPLHGYLESEGKIQIRVPPVLRDKFAKVSSAVYFHVKSENTKDLVYGNVVKVVVN